MGSLTSDLDILKGPVIGRVAPAIGQAVTPLAPNRTVYVSASMTATVLVTLDLVRAVLEVSDDGVEWAEADVGHSSAGVISFLRVLDGHSKLGAFVRPGQMYRFGGAGQGFGGSFTVQDLHETTIEISSHRSVGYEFLSGAISVPDNSHMHECGGPCFTPSLFIDQYKRDPSEGYRSFAAGTPPKGFVRAEAGGGGTGTDEEAYDFDNPGADDGNLDGWTAPVTGVVATTDQAHGTSSHSFGIAGVNINYEKVLYQDRDVSIQASDIDAGAAEVKSGAFIFISDASEFANLRLEFFDENMALISTSNGVTLQTGVNVPPGDWTEVEHITAVPPNTRTVRFSLVWQNLNGGANQVFFDSVQSLVVTTQGGAPVMGNLLVRGRKAGEGLTDSFSLSWRGVDYTVADAAVTFPTPTTWAFQGDPGAEIAAPGEMLTIRQLGQPDQQVFICVDRTAPSASLAFNGMTFGTDGVAPMLRGEYVKLLPTYSDTGVGIESAALVYENGGYWSGEPTTAPASGVATGYFRSAISAPSPGSSDITLRVTDKAGNVTDDTVTIFFGALPTAPSVTLSVLTGAERPAHLSHIPYGETAYNDNAIGGTVNISPVVGACRNSGRDDTRSQLLSGGFSITTSTHNDVANQASLVHATTAINQVSKLGAGIIGRVRDQHYRNTDSTEDGDYAFNASRAIDFGLDQTIGIGSPPFTGKAAEPFTDEFAGDALSNCRIFDGAVEWLANGAVLQVTVSLTSNNGQLYQPRLFDKSGSELLFATYGADVDVKLHDGAGFVGPVSGDSFGPNANYDLPALSGASAVQARIVVSDLLVPALGAFILNYKA